MLGSITGNICAPPAAGTRLEQPEGGLWGGQALLWKEKMAFPAHLGAKEAFLEGDNHGAPLREQSVVGSQILTVSLPLFAS